MEDQIMNFLIYRIAKSFYYINIIGYQYFRTSESITSKQLSSESYLKFIFYYLKFIFEYSKNTKCEKEMANHLLTKIFKGFKNNRYISSLAFNSDEFSFYIKILDMYLKCRFIDDNNKLIVQKLKNIIEKKKKYFLSLSANRTIKKE